jgi:hypothetical protein
VAFFRVREAAPAVNAVRGWADGTLIGQPGAVWSEAIEYALIAH